jgi:MarR family transcriptional regulator, 2-MHQ and catechol-resistance regulon repressor
MLLHRRGVNMGQSDPTPWLRLSALVAALEPQSPEVDCYFRLRRVNRLLESMVTDNFTGFRVRPAYYTVLHALRGGQTLSPTELRSHVLRGRSNMTTLLDRMERDGLVLRQPDPGDRRKYSMRLTAVGEELIAQAHPQHMEWIHQIMSTLSPKEISQLQALLERLWEGLNSQATVPGIAQDAEQIDDENQSSEG